jgi:hypothetical protein
MMQNLDSINFTFMNHIQFPKSTAGGKLLYDSYNTSPNFEQVGIQWETRDIPQDLAISFMHQLSSNSLFNQPGTTTLQLEVASIFS